MTKITPRDTKPETYEGVFEAEAALEQAAEAIAAVIKEYGLHSCVIALTAMYQPPVEGGCCKPVSLKVWGIIYLTPSRTSAIF